METSTIQKLKNRAVQLIEAPLLKSGRVLEVRSWEGAPMIEIYLHLPEADMEDWNDVHYIKFKVSPFTYRDYTPFGWDAETRTCSILIDRAHNGPGSRWAYSLQNSDTVHYLAIDHTHQSPHQTDMVVGLGDASSLGHLLALRQLTLPGTRFDGAVILEDQRAGQLFKNYFRSALTVLTDSDQLSEWLSLQCYCTGHTHFYLAGNNGLIANWRRVLKNKGFTQLRAKGFWS